MVNINEVYGGNYLNARIVESEELELTDLMIEDVELLEFPKTDEKTGKDYVEKKLGVRLEETDYTWILNKTNASKLGKQFGDETEDWIGETVQLVIVDTSFGKGIQVKFPPKRKAKAKKKATPNFKRLAKTDKAIAEAIETIEYDGAEVTMGALVTELKAMKAEGSITAEDFEKAGEKLGFE